MLCGHVKNAVLSAATLLFAALLLPCALGQEEPPGPPLRSAVAAAADQLKDVTEPPARVTVVPGDDECVEGAFAARLLAFFLRRDGADVSRSVGNGLGPRLAQGAERIRPRWLAGIRQAGATVVVLPVVASAAGRLRAFAYATDTGQRTAAIDLRYRLAEDLAFLHGAKRATRPASDQAWEELLERLLPARAGDNNPEQDQATCEALCLYELGQWAQAGDRLAALGDAGPDLDTVRMVMASQRAGRGADAMRHVMAALRRRPDSGPLYALKAWLVLRGERPEDALPLLEQARLSDVLREGYYWLARYLAASELGRRETAEQCLLKATQLVSAKDPISRLHAARHYWERGDAERAARFYEAAIEAGAPGAAPWLELSAALDAAGKAQQALEALRQAFEIDPGRSHVARSLAATLRAAGRHEEALAALAHAARLRPDRVELLVAYGDYAAHMWRMRDAEQAFAEAATLDGLFHGAAVRLAAVLRLQRRLDEAQSLLDEVLKKQPDYNPARLEMARLLIERGKEEEALELLGEVVRSPRHEVDARLEMARIHCAAGRGPQAVEEARISVSARPDADGFAVLGRAFVAVKDLPKAQEAVARALELAGRSPVGRLVAAELAHAQKRPDEALKHAEQAARMDPYCVQAHALVARLWAERNVGAHAVAQLRKALKLNPWDAGLHWEIAELLRASEPRRAMEHYRRHIGLKGRHAQEAAQRLAGLPAQLP